MKFNIDYRKYTKPCVVKIIFGNRYIITKSKDIKTTLGIFRHNLKLHERYGNTKIDNLYYHAVRYITRQKIEEANIELIIESDNQYEILKTEQTKLDECCQDKNCLNNNFEVYIPEWNEDKEKYGWLDKIPVMNFNKWARGRAR